MCYYRINVKKGDVTAFYTTQSPLFVDDLMKIAKANKWEVELICISL